jgi:thiol:disulfide interchange protein
MYQLKNSTIIKAHNEHAKSQRKELIYTVLSVVGTLALVFAAINVFVGVLQ